MKHVCIVGGGPAGLATSIALRQADFRVTVFDCATPPIDKACGEGLLPDSLAALRRLGISIPSGSGIPFHGIAFSDGRSGISARFSQGYAIGLRRTALHNLLLTRASELGVDLRWGARHSAEEPCDLLVAADGGNSHLRRQSGLAEETKESHRYGFRQHFRVAPWSPFMEVHWSENSQLYITPIAVNEVGVAVVSRNRHLRLRESLQAFPEVSQRLRNAVPTTAERGSLSTMRRLPWVVNPRIALVGDASGSVDVITGEGLGLAFQQALALAEALKAGRLESYAKAHRKIDRKPRAMAHLLLALADNPTLRRHAFSGLALCPALFSLLLTWHVGAERRLAAVPC